MRIGVHGKDFQGHPQGSLRKYLDTSKLKKQIFMFRQNF